MYSLYSFYNFAFALHTNKHAQRAGPQPGSSTTVYILATLHKLLPVHPTGHMLRVHIFDVGETNGSSYQQLAVCRANHTCIYVQNLSDMQTFNSVMNMHKVHVLSYYTTG